MVADSLTLQVAMVLLYLQLGVASLVALGSLILMMPVQVCCSELHTCWGLGHLHPGLDFAGLRNRILPMACCPSADGGLEFPAAETAVMHKLCFLSCV